MKLLRIGPATVERPAVLLDDSTALDLASVVDDFGPPFFANGGLDLVRDAVANGANELPRILLAGQRIGAPIARPYKILCIGLNYVDHARESGLEAPSEPVLFAKATNTMIGPNDDIWLPRNSAQVDFEVELGVVIGAEGRYLSDREAARQIIAGYCISHDVSERTFQNERGGQWIKGKSCETFNPLGPWLVTSDEVSNLADLKLELRLNGEAQQHGTTADMIFDVEHIVWYLSQFLVLEPGDLINTGTPAGVGMGQNPPRYLRNGDVVELEIGGLGAQRQTVRPTP